MAPRSRSQSGQETPDAAETAETAPVASPQDTVAPSPPKGAVKRYVMLVGVGDTKRGQEFDADDTDPRVKSGWARLVDEPSGPPAEVAAALEQ